MSGKIKAKDVERIINEIQIRPEIWNYNLPKHFQKCNGLLQEVADIFGVSCEY